MTKEEKIKEAYGEHYEKIKDYIYSDGWLDKLVFAVTDISYEDVAVQPFVHPPGTFCRPKSLEGIENNNGWIKIESESDLPKEKFNYSFVYCLKPEIISSVQNNIVRNDQLEELFEDEWITHYKPVTKSAAPIY